VRERNLVSDGPPVAEREPTPYETEVWSRYQAEQADSRRIEAEALFKIQELREAERRRQEPRKRRVQSQSYQDGEWVICYAPERRPSVELEFEEYD
jgi:hypothetical protein